MIRVKNHDVTTHGHDRRGENVCASPRLAACSAGRLPKLTRSDFTAGEWLAQLALPTISWLLRR
jgi:hypothetical protein